MRRAVALAGLLLLAVVLVRTAWLCDDAYITLRVVDNLLHGYGPRWNVAERVQVYTHPLWLLALVGPVAALGAYGGALALGAGITLGTSGWLLLRGAADTERTLVAAAALVASQAFVDFATSGLENPLAHALLLALAARIATLPRDPSLGQRTAVVALAALVGVDRLDHLVLVAPAVAWAVLRRPDRDAAKAVALGALPLVLWEGFALVYYGSPWPNTAYAKLGADLAAAALLRQGWTYLWASAAWDPATSAVIALGVLVGAVRGRDGERAWSLGIVLWLVYLVRAGGDHMAGRLLTAPFVVALWVLVRLPGPRWTVLAGLPALLVLGALAHTPPLTGGVDLLDNRLGPGDLTDERAYFYRITGLLRRPIDGPVARAPGPHEGALARAAGRHVVVREMIGWFAYYAGPDVHVVDPLGLGDPLMARIPAGAYLYRAGHYPRTVPNGYWDVAQDGGHLHAPGLDAYWQEVQLVTRGPLWTAGRWRAIADLLRPGIDPRVEAWCAAECSIWGEAGTRALDPPIRIPRFGFAVQLTGARRVRRVLLAAPPGTYRLHATLGGADTADVAVTVGDDGQPGIARIGAKADRIQLLTDPPGLDRRTMGILVEP